MKKSKSLSIEEINELTASISENWTPEADVKINKQTRLKKVSLALKGRKTAPWSEEVKRKLSLANKGKTRSEEERRKISLALKDRTLSEAHKERLKRIRRLEIVIDGVRYESYTAVSEAFGVSISAIGKRARMGMPISGEILKKIRNKEKGPLSDEHRRKISESRKGRPTTAGRRTSEETRKKQSAAHRNKGGRAVSIQGVVYPTVAEAGRQLGVIQQVVGSRVRSTAEEWKDWFFIDEK